MTSTAPTPTVLDKALTTRNRNLRTRRMEIWEATSADGNWTYIRIEDVGTSWSVQHNPTGKVRHFVAGSLLAARKLTAARGEALFDTY